MADSPDQPPPMAAAIEWVSRIFAISLEMVLPGLLGQWLDARWGTHFLVLLGFSLGLTAGVLHLLVMTRRPAPPQSRQEKDQKG